jgi:molybdopterin-biosynthesis enzyme MoeA-like protein
MADTAHAFGLIVIGDEILSGNRQDKHFHHFREMLRMRGRLLNRFWLLPDDAAVLTEHLRYSFARGEPVFCCGGIGATTDDKTRQCAAAAAGVALQRHPEAVALIESQYGQATYPTRVLMAELPLGCQLIPNAYNQIPGFILQQHYFLPGFPEMAWPMAEWVLQHFFATPHPLRRELSLQVLGAAESALVPIMQKFTAEYPELKMFSLPRLGEQPSIKLGFYGTSDLNDAFRRLQADLREQGIAFVVN